MTSNKAKIFISYSHKDESLKEQLDTHLAILKRNQLIEEWHDRKIVAGENWQSEIDRHLDDSDIVILLISPDFIASEYCYSVELKRAIERHEANQSLIIPVIVRPVNWTDAPFSKILALPTDAKPVTTWNNIDEAWMNVSKEIQKAVSNLAKLRIRIDKNTGLKQVGELLILEADRIDKIFQDESKSFSGLPTGINDLDNMLDGIHSADLIVIGSRPKNRSDDLAINIAKHVSIDAGLPVAYYSFQMTSNRLTQKLICAIGGINHHVLLRGLLEDEDWEKLTDALTRLNDAPLFIDDNNALTLDELIKNVKNLKTNTGALALIVIDSLQSLFFQNKSKDSTEHYSKSLKYLAKELQTPIIVTSNLNSESEKRIDRRPLIEDLSDWRCLENDADVILLSYADETSNHGLIDNSIIEILVSKNLYGPLGIIKTKIL